MSYTTESLDAILAQIDFKKAFDSIEWPFLMEALKKYNFGEEIMDNIALHGYKIMRRQQRILFKHL